MIKRKGRPNLGKEKLTLTINREVLITIKQIADLNLKTLSQLTEDCYRDIIMKYKGLQENPDEVMKQIQEQVKEIIELRNKQIKEEKKK